jgi:hypothetical protein
MYPKGSTILHIIVRPKRICYNLSTALQQLSRRSFLGAGKHPQRCASHRCSASTYGLVASSTVPMNRGGGVLIVRVVYSLFYVMYNYCGYYRVLVSELWDACRSKRKERVFRLADSPNIMRSGFWGVIRLRSSYAATSSFMPLSCALILGRRLTC